MSFRVELKDWEAARPTAALTATPLPSPLPSTTMSGSTPYSVKANNDPVRPKLACTSSRMKIMSCSREKRSSNWMYSCCGWNDPPPPK